MQHPKQFFKLNHTFLQHSATRYFIIGIFAFGTDYAVLLITYYVLGLPLFLATTLGFLSGFAISFLLNRYWVFDTKGQLRKRVFRQTIEYCLLVALNYGFTVWTIALLKRHGIEPFISKLGVMGLIMCWNYALFRWVIFTTRVDQPPA